MSGAAHANSYQYVKLPDGSWGKFAASASDDDIRAQVQKDFPDAFDTRNAIQKSFDGNTTTSPEEPLLETGLKSVVSGIGAPFIHPVATATAMGNLLEPWSSPDNPVHNAVRATEADYRTGGLPYATAKLAGNVFGGFATGEAAGAGVGAAGRVANVAGKGAEIAAATPESMRVAGTRFLTPGQSASDLFTRAAKPTSAYGDFENDLQMVSPELAKNAPRYGGLNGVSDTLEGIKNNSNTWYQNLIDPFRNMRVDTTPIADAQMRSIPITDQIENPARFSSSRMRGMLPPGEGNVLMPDSMTGGIVKNTAAKANPFRTELPLGDVDGVRVDTNAKLQSFWDKAGGNRAAALSNPETSRVFATNNAARDLTYDNLSRLSAAGRTDGGIPVPDIEANQNLYGAANKLDDVFNRRGVVFARQNPVSLQESLAVKPLSPVQTAVDFAGRHLFKSLTDSDALSNAALDKMRNPNITLEARPGMIPQAVSAAGRGMQAAGQAAARIPSQFFAVPTASAMFFAPKQ